ncbi:hypothetical protein ETD86_37395 [Nonomuraea turkmeniaca]|uniref:Uncharacterized protein n=1 Tax=Nonomuraea turkmeniaca TaxID=103838 RepID=A0A5S4F4Z3_9ACTN|nr:hypothetical protein [Nonomuraea turkmeniaca]TMR10994.1 hypothetical protein ETD86_37395 [Nonomuraea turkmeniaca]
MSQQDLKPISIVCGDCGTTDERAIAGDDMGQAARATLRRAGWRRDETGDHCPRHIPVKELTAQAGLPAGGKLRELLPELARYVLPPLAKAQPPIITVEDLDRYTDVALLDVAGFGAARLTKLKDALAGRIGRTEALT